MKRILLASACVIALLISSCNNSLKSTADSSANLNSIKIPDVANFEKDINGEKVSLYVLTNKSNAKVAITNYGARVVSIIVPNKEGTFTDVSLGYDSLESFRKEGEPFFGAVIGRYGNRIAKGKFVLEGKLYQLEINDGENTLHGGVNGFYGKVWKARQINDNSLELLYSAVDGEGGYPGNLNVKVVYTLTDENSLEIEYTATTDKKTIVNLTNHAYFNLNGEGDSTILDHDLMINANAITPVNDKLIPTGELMPVEGTPFDFNKPTAIGSRINDDNEQLKNGKGYDHNWVLNKKKGLQHVATLSSARTGIVMDVITTEPGLQFYSGNFLTGQENDGKEGKAYKYRSALCLETQHFPDSPNQPQFPSTVLKPGEIYNTKTIYKFSVK